MDGRSMRCAGVIPVRMGSARFPGKPLAPILGISMLEHVYRRSLLCRMLDEVVVATCDQEIRAAAEGFGARVLMTSDRHERAAERTAEASERLAADIIVMIQGDEPLVSPEALEELVAPLRADPAINCTNLMLSIDEAGAQDTDQVKVVCDLAGNALYMSRAPLPVARFGAVDSWWRQIGLIAFRREFLRSLMALPPTPLERAESVDMLRALEHGFSVRMVVSRHVTHPVDAPGDIPVVEALLEKDRWLRSYLKLQGA